jgi:hypothetical protein
MKYFKQISKFEKSSENSENLKIGSRKQKRKKPENITEKQKTRPYWKKNWALADGPRAISLRSRAERTKCARGRSIGISSAAASTSGHRRRTPALHPPSLAAVLSG